MKKGDGKYCKKILFLILIVITILPIVSGLGINSGLIRVDFKPGMELNYDFQVLEDSNTKVELYALGDFSDLVQFDKKTLNGGEGFHVKIKLPETIEKPGKHIILIGARETFENEEGNIGTGVAIQIPIIIEVPYPGKYAEINFNCNNANFGENIKFEVDVASMGNEPIFASTSIEIYNNGKKIDVLDLGSKIIENQNSDKFIKYLNSSIYNPGDYEAVAIVNYENGVAKANSLFRIGRLFVDVANYTKEVIKKGIKPFEISIESFWNDPIENIYAEVYITKDSQDIANFLTPSVNLNGWEKKNLLGYIDTEKLEIGEYDSIIKLKYKNNETIVNGKLNIKNENNYTPHIITGVVILILLIIFLVYKKYFSAKSKGKKNVKKS